MEEKIKQQVSAHLVPPAGAYNANLDDMLYTVLAALGEKTYCAAAISSAAVNSL